MGMLPPASGAAGPELVVVTIVLTALMLAAAVLGGYKRVEKMMTALLLVILASFIVVAIKGLMDWHTWVELGRGLVPQVPEPVPVVGSDRMRDGFTQLMGIAGQALPPAVFLSTKILPRTPGTRYRCACRWRSSRSPASRRSPGSSSPPPPRLR